MVHGAGQITAASTDLLQTTVRRLIPESKRIVLDLTGEYIDSSGLGALVSIYLAAGRADCELELSNPKQRVRDSAEGHQTGLSLWRTCRRRTLNPQGNA